MNSSLAAGTPLLQPLYKAVRLRLTRSLEDGEWKPGEAIPSETRLAREFRVSVGTVRKAIDELVAEKILVRQQGRGTFVAAHTEDRNFFHFFHIHDREGTKRNPVTELLAFTHGSAHPEEADRLGIARGDPVYRIRNLLRITGIPVLLDDIAIAAARFSGLDTEAFGQREGTIYGLYQQRYGISVIRIAERLSACLADSEAAGLLGVAPGAPLLRIARVAYSYHDTPVEYRVSRVNTANHEYYSDLLKT